MSKFNRRRRVVFAALLATATIGSAMPAQASTGAGTASADCDVRLEQITAQFREIEERRGYEAATEWWQKRWHAYYQSCGGN